jgi:hypothetical protein
VSSLRVLIAISNKPLLSSYCEHLALCLRRCRRTWFCLRRRSPNVLARTVRWLAQTRLARIQEENCSDPFVRRRDYGANETFPNDLGLVASGGLFAS